VLAGKLFFPHDQNPKHIKALDGLRGFAVLLVLLSHTSNAEIFLFEGLDFSGIGKTGVYLFFILSAYLLDGQIVYRLEQKKATGMYWKNYFLRRFLRIYPLFTVALIVYFSLDAMGLTTAINDIRDISGHLLLSQGKSIFWSIPVEFLYYFLSPVIIFICYKWFHWNLKLVLPLFVMFMVLVLMGNRQGLFSEISTLRFLTIFLFGALLAILELVRPAFFSSIKARVVFEVAGWVALLLLIFSAPAFFKKVSGFSIHFSDPVYHPLFGFFGAFLIIACKYGKGWIKRLFEWRLLRFFGVISFSMYLTHTLALKAVNHLLDIPAPQALLTFFFITIVISSISYLLVEKPLMRFRIVDKLKNSTIK
jgi:peptidoglycan/LPS O-acetylase OafA/YrhL